MKIDSDPSSTVLNHPALITAYVSGETQPLTDVVLSGPTYLAPVPCCSVTRENLKDGYTSSIPAALLQHRDLRKALISRGVNCHDLPSNSGMPDLCFTRDIAVATPWGLVALSPAARHRLPEVDHFMRGAREWTSPQVERINIGVIEGGDICIARPGLLIVGVSDERTCEDGAEAFAARFRAEGWTVLIYRLDPHFLHLDTIFCMVEPGKALACTDVLDDVFLSQLAALGIEVLPVSYKDARRLGCNVLAIGEDSVLANAATPRVSSVLRTAGMDVVEIEIDEFTACGGGIHCLTMPLRRAM